MSRLATLRKTAALLALLTVMAGAAPVGAAPAAVPAGTAPVPAAPAAGTVGLEDVPALAELADRWRGAMEDLAVPGLAVAILRPGEPMVVATFGIRDAERREPVTPETIFYIASVTKTYVAVLLSALAEDRVLDLDAPVRRYLPQLRLPDEKLAASITVRDLLCHRHGIDRSEIVWLDAYTGQITEADYFRLLAGAEVAGKVAYSNVHFTLAGRVVEAVTGRPWKDVLQERVLDRAGLARTTASATRMYADADHAEPMASVAGQWLNLPVRKTDRVMHAAGGLGTSILDAAKWLRLHLDQGAVDGQQVVAAATMEDLLAFHSRFDQPQGRIRIDMGYGLGWQRGTYRPDGPVQYRHGGGYQGAAAELTFLPERGLGVAVLANAGGAGNALTALVQVDVLDKLLAVEAGTDLLPGYRRMAASMREKLARELPNGPAPGRQVGLSLPPDSYAGRYRHPDQGEAEILLAEGRLSGRIGDLPLQLHAAGLDSFQATISPGMLSRGRFEIGGGRVTALWLKADGEELTRFVRE
jgi:CubicO group peptidase (beta-lactamase class C family)